MAILFTLYNDGKVKMQINKEDVYKGIYEFYYKDSNKVDMRRHKPTADFKTWDKTKYVKLAKDNPIKFLLKSEGDFFRSGNGYLIELHEDMRELIKNDDFIEHMRDDIFI